MNVNKLYSILQNNAQITDFSEIEKISEQYPYFSVPQILCISYLYQSNDSRYSDALKKFSHNLPNRKYIFQNLKNKNPKGIDTPSLKKNTEEDENKTIPIIPTPSNPIISNSPTPQQNNTPDTTPQFTCAQNITSTTSIHSLNIEPISIQPNPDFIYKTLNLTPTPPHSTQPISYSNPPTPNITQPAPPSQQQAPNSTQTIPDSTQPASNSTPQTSLTGNTTSPNPTQPPPSEDISKELNKSISESIIQTELLYIEPSLKKKAHEVASLIEKNTSSPEKLNIQQTHLDTNVDTNVDKNINTLHPAAIYPLSSALKRFASNNKPLSTSSITNSKNPLTSSITSKKEKIKQQQEIIDKIIANPPRSIKPTTSKKFFSAEDKAKESLLESEDLVSETLAQIYVAQGNIHKAIRAYEILALKFPQKNIYFAAKIQELKKQLKNN